MRHAESVPFNPCAPRRVPAISKEGVSPLLFVCTSRSHPDTTKPAPEQPSKLTTRSAPKSNMPRTLEQELKGVEPRLVGSGIQRADDLAGCLLPAWVQRPKSASQTCGAHCLPARRLAPPLAGVSAVSHRHSRGARGGKPLSLSLSPAVPAELPARCALQVCAMRSSAVQRTVNFIGKASFHPPLPCQARPTATPRPSPAAPGLQDTLRTASSSEAGSVNALGDKQLVADLEADNTIYAGGLLVVGWGGVGWCKQGVRG